MLYVGSSCLVLGDEAFYVFERACFDFIKLAMTLNEWLSNLLEYDGKASQYIFYLLNGQCILGLQLVQISSVGRIDLHHQLIR